MLRRFSTRVGIGRGKKGTGDEDDGHATNGVPNGTSKPTIEKRYSSFAGLKPSKRAEAEDNSASRKDVDHSFSQFAQLLHASRRPLPNQCGDAAYLDHAEPSGLMGDVKKLGFKDAKTLMEVMKTKASGELQDDKTYIMERTIQVRLGRSRLSLLRLTILDSWWLLSPKRPKPAEI